jgi:heme/copper-type cytochrome/quinol oxidase subunit 3
VLLAGLSTGHKIGLLVVGGAFVAFALTSSMLAPRRRPDFPGRAGLSVFIIACAAFFAAMLLAVIFLGKEKKEPAKKSAPAPSARVEAAQAVRYRVASPEKWPSG